MWQRLGRVYDEGEAKAVARMVYEVRYGLSQADLLMGRDSEVPSDELEQIAQRLECHEPVQYVLGVAEFCGRTFVVNEHVLIPRPETEELCRQGLHSSSILDIGTGSGCIAVTLAAMYPEAEVTAWDISEEALAVARENARRNGVKVKFEKVDILSPPPAHFSLIISNPPYICNKERARMKANVLDYEPHTALFVPDDDPLLFYRAIAQFGQTALTAGGRLWFEVNPLYAQDVAALLRRMSYHDIEVKEDQFGKQRFIKASR